MMPHLMPHHLSLLHACLSTTPDSYHHWAHRVDFDNIDPASYKLLPFLARNPALSFLQDPIINKCRGIYRNVWVENQLVWNRITHFLAHLREAIPKIVLLKGIAMILHHYQDFGIRVIGDIDILIPRHALPLADEILRRHQWKSNVSRFNLQNEHYLNRWHALNLTHSNLNLDLHWSLIQENCPAIDEIILCDAIPYDSFYLPTPTDLFFQTCIHGAKHSPVPLIRWIVDAMTLLKTSPIDWSRLYTLASLARVCLPLFTALSLLRETFGAPIPHSLIRNLQAVPSIPLETLEYRFHIRGHTELATWCRYCLNRNHLTKISQLRHLINYLQHTARLKSPWHIPLYAPYWLLKRLYRKFRSQLQKFTATQKLTSYQKF